MTSSSDLSSIETWAFRPAFENAWISDAFSRDSDILIQALQKSLCNSDDFTFDASPNAATFSDLLTPETPSSQYHGQSVSSSAGSEPDTASKRGVSRRSPPAPTGKIAKRKIRASKRSPTMFINADPSNFRQMVQEVTGVQFVSGKVPVGSVVKPEPQRAAGVVNRFLLPTLDTSAFLLDRLPKVAPPPSAPASGGFGPPGVVAEGSGAGFDFDGFSCFPTLDSSWKVM